MRWAPPLLAAVLAACGPGTVADEVHTCGGEGPVRLLTDVSVGLPAYAGERLVVHTWSFPIESTETEAFAVGNCGEEPVSLGMFDLTAPPLYSVAGPHGLSVGDDGDVAWVDTFDRVPSHPLFSNAASCLLSVGDGLVAQVEDGSVWFHPDPASADVSPRRIVERAIAPDFPSLPGVPFSELGDCWAVATERPVLDGDGILVAEADGPLVRIALPSGEREVLVAGPVGEFLVLDNPRYLLWRGGSESRPDEDCCSIHRLDRRTGVSEKVAGGLIEGDVGWSGEWLSTAALSSDGEQVGTFHNYVTGASIRVGGWWNLQAPLSSTELLVAEVGEPNVRILEVSTGVLYPVDFPQLDWPERTYDDGVVALEKAHPDDPRGDLLRLRFGSRRPEILATEVPVDWTRTQSGNLLFVDRDEPGLAGPLVLVESNGDRRELAGGVSAFTVPSHGTERERNEVIYFVDRGEDRGMWRLVLP